MIKPQHRSITRGGWGEAAIKGGADYFVGVLRKNAEKRENSGRHGHVRHVGNELAVRLFVTESVSQVYCRRDNRRF